MAFELSLYTVSSEWKDDSDIKIKDLADESIKTPSLHAKYLDYLISAKKQLQQREVELNKYRVLRSKYFKHELSKDELKEHGWEPYQFNKPVKQELDDLLLTDQTFIDLSARVNDGKTLVTTCEKILDSIGKRDYAIGNATKLILYSNGLN